MENGFSPAPSPFETLEERIRRVPLPYELPQGLDFTGIPAAALKSSTIDSLISQNEDLMARLSVALRKINDLETSSGKAERDVTQLRQRFEALKEQYLVLREKDRISSTRGADLQRQNTLARERGEKLERQFASVFVQGQAFQRRLQRLERYRARVTKAAVNLRARARLATKLESDVQLAEREVRRLTGAYESRLVEALEQVARLDGKARERDRLFKDNVRLENELVHERRQGAAARHDQQTVIDRLSETTEGLRRELEQLTEESASERTELARVKTALPEIIAARDALTEQVESLQSLWAQKQRDLDQAEEKIRNLQKLNQSLSVTLNEQRRELSDQRAVHEQHRFAADERAKTLRTEIELLRRPPAHVND